MANKTEGFTPLTKEEVEKIAIEGGSPYSITWHIKGLMKYIKTFGLESVIKKIQDGVDDSVRELYSENK